MNPVGIASADWSILKKHLDEFGYRLTATAHEPEKTGRTKMSAVLDAYGAQCVLKVISKEDQTFEVIQKVRSYRLPNVPRWVHMGELDHFVWYIEEWIPGQTIDQWVKTKNDWKAFCKIVIQLCWLLRRLEAQQILHLDIKPEHILIDGHDSPFLIDFSTCRIHKEALRTGETGCFTTPEFSAPELINAPWQVGYGSDRYSFAVVLISLMCLFKEPQNDLLTTLIQMTHHDAVLRLKELHRLEKGLLKHLV